MTTVYGPVPSRRLGRSLGIDPVSFKTCNYSCVYCQLGRTVPYTVERKVMFEPETVLEEVHQALATAPPGSIDFVTISGQGEPTLYSGLGEIIRGVGTATERPVAVLTNGSLFSRGDVRQELSAADVVMPSVDAADDATFHRINRPAPDIRLSEVLAGLRMFRRSYSGQLWIEVMLVAGVNDSEPALRAIAEALALVRPDEIHLNVPVRPPAESWVRVPDVASLRRAAAILGEIAPMEMSAAGEFALAPGVPIVDAIVEVLCRHPMSHVEIEQTIEHVAPGRRAEVLAALTQSERVGMCRHEGRTYWVYSRARYSGEGHDGEYELA